MLDGFPNRTYYGAGGFIRRFALLLVPVLVFGGWTDLSDNIPWPNDTLDLSDVHFIGQEGWVSASWPRDSGVVFHTTDGGETFEAQRARYGVISLEMKDTETGFACGYEGRVYHTSSGGDSWRAIGTTCLTTTSVSVPPGSDTGYCCSFDGGFFRVTPEGVSRIHAHVAGDLDAVSFPVSPDTGWTVGGSLILNFLGDTWGFQSYPSGGYNAVHMVDNSTGWAVGDVGVLIHTTDGRNWVTQTNPDTLEGSLYGVFFLDLDNGWAVSASGGILRTSDGGEAWHLEAEGMTSRFLRSVFAVDTNEVYVVGNKKTFLKYTGGPGVEERAEGGGMKAEPMKPTILSGPELMRMDCRVIDIQGRDVTDEKARLSPGVYFVGEVSKGRGSKGSRVRKVILQR